MHLIFRIAQFTLFGDRFHGEGFHIGPRDSDFTGWFDSADVSFDDTQRPAGFGVFAGAAEAPARQVSVSGFVVADSHARLRHWGEGFAGLAGRSVRPSVETDLGVQWADMRVLNARCVPSVFVPEGAFSLRLSAPDPRIFGDRHRFTGSSVQVSHYGNFAASPVITVSGSAPSGYTVTGPGGRQFVVTRALVSGQPHVIDMSTGWLSVAGVVVTGGVGRADTWSVPPGVQTVMSVSGGLTLTVDVLDTFI